MRKCVGMYLGYYSMFCISLASHDRHHISATDLPRLSADLITTNQSNATIHPSKVSDSMLVSRTSFAWPFLPWIIDSRQAPIDLSYCQPLSFAYIPPFLLPVFCLLSSPSFSHLLSFTPPPFSSAYHQQTINNLSKFQLFISQTLSST